MKSPNSQIKLLTQLGKVNQQGFTLLELLVAILAATLFLAFSLEAMVLATFTQIRAREKAEAALLIQRQFEDIRAIAATYGIEPPLSEEDLSDRCAGIWGAEGNEGLAAGLAAEIPDAPDLVDIYASNRQYPLERTITVSPTNMNLLEVRYKITDGNEDLPHLADLYTEVIASVSFKCE